MVLGFFMERKGKKMKKLALIFVLFFLVILFLVPNVSAFNNRQQVITGTFQAYDWYPEPSVLAKIRIIGSANISPSGSLETTNQIRGGDINTIIFAFFSLAESLNCTVGNTYRPDDPSIPPREGQSAIDFVCDGTRGEVLNKTTELLSFPLTVVADEGQ